MSRVIALILFSSLFITACSTFDFSSEPEAKSQSGDEFAFDAGDEFASEEGADEFADTESDFDVLKGEEAAGSSEFELDGEAQLTFEDETPAKASNTPSSQSEGDFDIAEEMPQKKVAKTKPRTKVRPSSGSLNRASNGSYTVKKGDTLMWIAFKVYGDYGRWREIARMNNLSSYELPAGTKLKVGSSNFEWSPQGNPYLIVRGDTLGKISDKVYGQIRYWKAIYENNRPMIKDPNLIFAGFTIYTPEANQLGQLEKDTTHQLAVY